MKRCPLTTWLAADQRFANARPRRYAGSLAALWILASLLAASIINWSTPTLAADSQRPPMSAEPASPGDDAAFSTTPAAPAAASTDAALELSDRFEDLHIEMRDGQRVVVVDTPHGPLVLDGQQLLALVDTLQQRSEQRSWPLVLLNISGWTGVVWVALGVTGQVLFTSRMLLQWIASERAARSVVPTAFWWLSLLGATMLIIYFLWRKDIVGVLGQSTGWAIYLRNLYLIHFGPNSPARLQTPTQAPAPTDAASTDAVADPVRVDD